MFDPEELTGKGAPLATYQEDSGETSQMEMLKGLTLTKEEYTDLAEYASQKGIDYIVTPFDSASADFLTSLSVPAIKIPSCEVTNLPFLEHVAGLGLPVILSTGTCNIEEVDDAVSIFKQAGVSLSVLHCTSSYPTPFDQINLRVMQTLRQKFTVPVGISDHSEGIVVPIAAAALGAAIVEKHFTLDRSMTGPDHKASIEPGELIAMVQGIRDVESALGSPEKIRQPAEENTALVARRSVIADQDLKAGDILTKENTALKRPGSGIPPKEYATILGRSLSQDATAGTPITHAMLS
jgi:sialic acid synthase SpsE